MSLTGIVGSVLILIAWLFETEESIRKHKSLVDLKFAFIYIVGIILLTIYSIEINEMIFVALNIALTVLIVFEILYTIYKKKIK
jgi:lipid-A-disaccharide synthase-like uncharacterized protein